MINKSKRCRCGALSEESYLSMWRKCLLSDCGVVERCGSTINRYSDIHGISICSAMALMSPRKRLRYLSCKKAVFHIPHATIGLEGALSLECQEWKDLRSEVPKGWREGACPVRARAQEGAVPLNCRWCQSLRGSGCSHSLLLSRHAEERGLSNWILTGYECKGHKNIHNFALFFTHPTQNQVQLF